MRFTDLVNQIFRVGLALTLMGTSTEAALSPVPGSGVDTVSPSVASPAMDAASSERMDIPDSLSKSTSGVLLPKSPITMNFHEADIRDVIRLLALKSNMNIIYGSDVTGAITLHLDRVPFDQAFQTVMTLKSLVALPLGEKIVRVVSATALTAEQQQAAIFTKVFRLNYASATDVKSPIDAVRGAAGRRGISSIDTKSNALILTDTPEGLQQAENLIYELDRKPQQVDIEAKIVEVNLNKDTNIGLSWSFARSRGQNDIGGGTLTDSAASAPGTRADPSGSVNYFVPNNPAALSETTAGGTGLNLLPTTVGQAALTFLHSENAFRLAATVSALVDKGNGKVLSNPHILTLNNEEARINAVQQIPYRTTSQNGSSSTENVSFIDAGIKLTVKPTINSDRRITLKVKPEVSVPLGSGSPPPIRSRNVETTVTLKDGDTLAIGGLIQDQDDKTITGIPILMSIPLLGYLFKREVLNKRRTELIVFITPRIAGE